MKSKVIYSVGSFKFIQGELYISRETGSIIICNESTDSNYFTGTCLVKGDCSNMHNPWRVGQICSTCYGSAFIPFTGTIELTGGE